MLLVQRTPTLSTVELSCARPAAGQEIAQPLAFDFVNL
jgi:hypothetical protein